jgi:transcriptional regulator with XRE-family HTH domain
MTEKLADRLRELLTLRSMSAKEVSLKAGLGETYISDILQGKNKNPRASGCNR